jgi:type IV pilus assembly protein PilA
MDHSHRSAGSAVPSALLEQGERSVGDPGAHRHGVLRWSGPDGWRDSRPRLVPRGVSVGAVATDAGFSMIELLVALLVMGILMAIAVPTFLGTTGQADDRSAQSNLTTAFIDAKSQFQNAGQTYDVNGVSNAVALANVLNGNQLQMTFKAGSRGSTVATGSSGGAADVSLAVSADGTSVVLAAYSVPGNCFYLVDNTAVLSTASAAVNPYVGTRSVTTVSRAMSGPIGLPTVKGTSYVTVAGDSDKADCNAYRPRASVAGVTASYHSAGFPS